MKIRRYDIVKITDENHWNYGQEVFAIHNEDNIISCITSPNYTTYLQHDQYEFIKRPRKNDVPGYVLNYFND